MPRATEEGDSPRFNLNWPRLQDDLLMQVLHENQHPANCLDRKFLVYWFPKHDAKDTRNIGALTSTLWRWILLAMEDNRTVVIDDYNWNMADCPSNKEAGGGLRCYFEHFSSCTLADVHKVHEYTKLLTSLVSSSGKERS